jgi:hypothetical protein
MNIEMEAGYFVPAYPETPDRVILPKSGISAVQE